MAVTIKEIAAHAGISYQAVSAVLNGDLRRVSEAKREKIFTLAQELGYRPNAAARALVSGKTKLIGFITQDIRFPYHADLSYQIHQEAERRGYRILMMESNWDNQRTEECLRSMLNYQVDGILTIGLPLSECELELLNRNKVPIVLVDDRASRFAAVEFNYQPGMTAAFELLINSGHRTIALAHDPVNDIKLNAYLECCRKFEIEPQEFHYRYPTIGGDQQVLECGRQVTLAAKRPDALIVASDYDAALFIQAFAGQGIKVPDNISLISIDDTFICSITQPQLTSIRLDRTAMALAALDLLEDRIGNPDALPEHRKCDTVLMQRQSVKIRG